MTPNEIAMRVLNLPKKMKADLRLNPRLPMFSPADRIGLLSMMGVAWDRASRIGIDPKLYTLFVESMLTVRSDV